MSLCHWKLKEWKKMIEVTNVILEELDSDNAKAFYRKLTALLNLKEYEEVKEKYTEFKYSHPDLEKNNPEFLDLMKKNDKKLAKFYKEQRSMYSKVLG